MREIVFLLILAFIMFASCQDRNNNSEAQKNIIERIPLIFDTDANNELDDQHALAYLLFNQDIFDVKGMTVNATRNGGGVDQHYEEAARVMELAKSMQDIPLLKGADADFMSIKDKLSEPEFDGQKAVDFIIEKANKAGQEKLIVLAVGKLTNIALAYAKAPEIIKKTRLVWLGSNYPESGEYNLDNDTTALQYLIQQKIPFEMVMVRYGKPTGSDAVRVQQKDILENVKGKGPHIENPITGRHGGEFYNFGDYSASLFEHIEYYGDPPSRALFDLVAVAIIKNPGWGEYKVVEGIQYSSNTWQKTDSEFGIGIWENFDKEKIIEDFYNTLEEPVIKAE